MFGILAMVSVVNSLLLVPLTFAVILFGCVLRFYLRPAQDLKRLEGISKNIHLLKFYQIVINELIIFSKKPSILSFVCHP